MGALVRPEWNEKVAEGRTSSLAFTDKMQQKGPVSSEPKSQEPWIV